MATQGNKNLPAQGTPAPTTTKDSKHALKPNLADHVEQLKDQVNELTLQLIVLDPDTPEYMAIDQKILAFSSKMETLNNLVEAQRPKPVDPRIISQVPIFQMASFTKNDPSKPIWSDIDAFIRRFEKILDLYDLDKDTNWKHCLSFAMDGEEVDLWFCHRLAPLDCTWDAAKLILQDTFPTHDRLMASIPPKNYLIDNTLKLVSITMAPKESISDFRLRFENLLDLAKMKDDQTAAMICLHALPNFLQENVIDSFDSEDLDALPTSASQILQIAYRVSAQKRSIHGQDYSEKTDHTSKRQKNHHCSHHGANASHPTKDCKKLQQYKTWL